MSVQKSQIKKHIPKSTSALLTLRTLTMDQAEVKFNVTRLLEDIK
jgi:hypothetical protein